MTTVSAKQPKDHPGALLSRVQYGKECVAVTRQGKEVAAVASVECVCLLDRLEDIFGVDERRARLPAKESN